LSGKKWDDTSLSKRVGESWTCEFITTGLRYILTTIMPFKKDIYCNWTKKTFCGDYWKINIFMKFDCCAMSTSENNFDAFSHTKVFYTLNLWLRYHQLGIKEVNEEKMHSRGLMRIKWSILSVEAPSI